jgi:NAD(P) transhydrogenase
MANEPKTYDLVVIGGGPAGITAATTAANFHKTVALIDSHREIGGAGINTGTVPSKTLRETALALSGFQSRNLYGVDLSLRREVTVPDFLRHEEKVRDGFHASITERLKSMNAEIYWGAATLTDPHTVNVQLFSDQDGKQVSAGETQLHAEKIFIATGSSPVRPAMFPFDDGEIYDSDTILHLDRIPKVMGVVGAGVIGAEYGCTFRALNSEVHIIDGRDVLLPFLDGEVSRVLAETLTKSGITFHWKEKVVKCEALPDRTVKLSLSSGKEMPVDVLLVAAGRQSNTANLGLDKVGVTVGERGLIPVDEHFQTNIGSIYAAGDVIGFPALASTSMEQARRAVRHALGLEGSKLSPLLPNGIYTIPEVSMVGETEESLRKKNINYIVGRANYWDNARGRIIGDSDGFLKLIYRREDLKLLGVHIMGELATEVVHVGLVAMMCNASANLFVDACLNVPTLGVLYKSATLNALEQLPANGKPA